MNADERAVYRLVFKLKEALQIILEEAEYGQDWDIVRKEAANALAEFED